MAGPGARCRAGSPRTGWRIPPQTVGPGRANRPPAGRGGCVTAPAGRPAGPSGRRRTARRPREAAADPGRPRRHRRSAGRPWPGRGRQFRARGLVWACPAGSRTPPASPDAASRGRRRWCRDRAPPAPAGPAAGRRVVDPRKPLDQLTDDLRLVIQRRHAPYSAARRPVRREAGAHGAEQDQGEPPAGDREEPPGSDDDDAMPEQRRARTRQDAPAAQARPDKAAI